MQKPSIVRSLDDDNDTSSQVVESNHSLDTQIDLDQYFTTNEQLQQTVFNFVKNRGLMLEPSFGAGHLLLKFKELDIDYPMKCYEIDTAVVPVLDFNQAQELIYGDFLSAQEKTLFGTIVTNPPFNRAHDFVEKCFSLLAPGGELVVICPSAFTKQSSNAKLLSKMTAEGSFTHFLFPHNEKLFKNAAVDIVVFRYERGLHSVKALVNDVEMFCNTERGIITFSSEDISTNPRFEEFFHVGVSAITGKDEVFNQAFGNMKFLVREGEYEDKICIDSYPCGIKAIDDHMLANKDVLLARRGTIFAEHNWFKWLRFPNKAGIEANMGKPCIYVRTIVRSKDVAFIGVVTPFAGSLICLTPRNDSVDLSFFVTYLNGPAFKANYTYSGRFIIGQKQLAAAVILVGM